jgi:hypothetical protein
VPNGKAVIEEEPEEHGDSSLVRTGRFALTNINRDYFSAENFTNASKMDQPSNVMMTQ